MVIVFDMTFLFIIIFEKNIKTEFYESRSGYETQQIWVPDMGFSYGYETHISNNGCSLKIWKKFKDIRNFK